MLIAGAATGFTGEPVRCRSVSWRSSTACTYSCDRSPAADGLGPSAAESKQAKKVGICLTAVLAYPTPMAKRKGRPRVEYITPIVQLTNVTMHVSVRIEDRNSRMAPGGDKWLEVQGTICRLLAWGRHRIGRITGLPARVTRHNHRASRKASNWSLGLYREGFTRSGVVWAKASSFSRRSAWRYI